MDDLRAAQQLTLAPTLALWSWREQVLQAVDDADAAPGAVDELAPLGRQLAVALADACRERATVSVSIASAMLPDMSTAGPDDPPAPDLD